MASGRRWFHGWKVASAGSLILALQSALIIQSFSSYAVVLRQQFGWSKATMSVAFAFNRAESGLLGPIHGWALSRYGAKLLLRIGAVLVAVGFVWFSRVDTAGAFIGSFIVISIGAGLGGFLTITSETVLWFRVRRARALALASFGIATGGMAVPLVVLALRLAGWRTTALVSGLGLAVVLFALSGLYGSTPQSRGQPVDGSTSEPGNAVGGAICTTWDLSLGEAMRTSAFWFLAFGHASALLVVGSVLAHLSVYLTEELDYSLQGASFVAGCVPLAQIAGMVFGGIVGDRCNKRYLCAVAMGGHVFGLLLLAQATNVAMVWAFVVLHGFAWGMRGPLMSAIRADYFGVESFGKIMGATSVVLMFGIAGGPLFAGYLADTMESYRPALSILAIIASLGTLMFLLAQHPSRPHGGDLGTERSS